MLEPKSLTFAGSLFLSLLLAGCSPRTWSHWKTAARKTLEVAMGARPRVTVEGRVTLELKRPSRCVAMAS